VALLAAAEGMREVGTGGEMLGLGEDVCSLYTIGTAGTSELLGLMPAHGLRCVDCFRVVLGQHYGLRLQPSTAQRRARAGPGPKSSCWARARVGPKVRALGWPMGLVLFGHLYL
jgi:hypothetical protein